MPTTFVAWCYSTKFGKHWKQESIVHMLMASTGHKNGETGVGSYFFTNIHCLARDHGRILPQQWHCRTAPGNDWDLGTDASEGRSARCQDSQVTWLPGSSRCCHQDNATIFLSSVQKPCWSGWWFGCHVLFSHIYWVSIIIPIDELIFFRTGWLKTTKQFSSDLDFRKMIINVLVWGKHDRKPLIFPLIVGLSGFNFPV